MGGRLFHICLIFGFLHLPLNILCRLLLEIAYWTRWTMGGSDPIWQFLCLVTIFVLFLFTGMAKILILPQSAVVSPLSSLILKTILPTYVNCRVSTPNGKASKAKKWALGYFPPIIYKKVISQSATSGLLSTALEHGIPFQHVLAFHLELMLHACNHCQCQKPMCISIRSKCCISIFQRKSHQIAFRNQVYIPTCLLI